MNMDKRPEYTLIAEGYAEYGFIPIYVKRVFSQFDVLIKRSRLGFKGRDAGKSKVMKDAEDICSTAIQSNHFLIIIGVDLDVPDHTLEHHKVQCQAVVASIGDNYKEYSQRIIHYVPVQAIEHWLAYQAYKIGISPKFADNSVESKSQGELKQLLYKGRNNGPTMDNVAQAIAEKADFDELARQSRSFKHFHNQVVQFLRMYSKTD